MATRSRVSAIKTKLVELLTTEAATVGSPIEGVEVKYAKPAQWERETIYMAGARFRHSLPVMRAGRKPRDEEFIIFVAIQAAAPGRGSDEAEQRAFVFLGELEDVLADDPTLGGLVEWAQVGDVDTGETPDFEGYAGHIQVEVTGKARLT